MDWNQLLSPKRLGVSATALQKRDVGSSFDADVHRIVFAGCFRRLSRKSQVHPLAPNDHLHTRLTHSLEVAAVGLTLGKCLSETMRSHLPKNVIPNQLGVIVEAACLAHDLGNPPFGHAGESAISHWFEHEGSESLEPLGTEQKKDVSHFDGNAQGFRVLTQTDNHLFGGGIRLTLATLGAFLKYPWTSKESTETGKFGAFLSEEAVLSDVASQLGLSRKPNMKWAIHPLAHLVEAADDICYSITDLEDGVELAILRFEEVSELLLSVLDSETRKEVERSFERPEWFRVNFTRLEESCGVSP